MEIPVKLYRYRPLSDDLLERELNALQDSYLFAPSFSAMNDPMEAFYKTGGPADRYFDALFSGAGLSTATLYKPMEEMISKFALVSFACSHEDLPMWAYYGCNFAGMCLEFDPAALAIGDFQQERLHKVSYEREPLPPLTIADLLPSIESALVARLTRKRIEWAHEREWRYITAQVGPKHYLDDALTRVYLGPRVDPKHAERVCRVLRNRPVEVMKGEIRDFELHFSTLQPAASLPQCERVGSGKFDPANDLYPDDELKGFLGRHFDRLMDVCRNTALRPNMEGFGGVGISSTNKQSVFLWTRYKLRSGRDVYHQRYFDKSCNLIP